MNDRCLVRCRRPFPPRQSGPFGSDRVWGVAHHMVETFCSQASWQKGGATLLCVAVRLAVNCKKIVLHSENGHAVDRHEEPAPPGGILSRAACIGESDPPCRMVKTE